MSITKHMNNTPLGPNCWEGHVVVTINIYNHIPMSSHIPAIPNIVDSYSNDWSTKLKQEVVLVKSMHKHIMHSTGYHLPKETLLQPAIELVPHAKTFTERIDVRVSPFPYDRTETTSCINQWLNFFDPIHSVQPPMGCHQTHKCHIRVVVLVSNQVCPMNICIFRVQHPINIIRQPILTYTHPILHLRSNFIL